LAHRLLSSEPVGAAEIQQLAGWLSALIPPMTAPEYRKTWAPALRAVGLAPPPTLRHIVEPLRVELDDTVSGERALDFIVALSQELQARGGRLCLGQAGRARHG
jgi:hypothetical protein